MKNLITQAICLFTLVLITNRGCAQKMVQVPNDAKKLMENENIFKNQPFRNLLEQIEPPIQFAYGAPDYSNGQSSRGTYIKFFFVNKDSFNKAVNPIGVSVTFNIESNNNRQPIPIGGKNLSTKDLLENYGDMIIMEIYVTGNN
jgi:hypothetical protein